MKMFRKAAAWQTWPGLGQYRETVAEGGEKSALIGCPNCGTKGSLRNTHRIGPDGKVTPSVRCPGNGVEVCSFHEMVILEGWKASP